MAKSAHVGITDSPCPTCKITRLRLMGERASHPREVRDSEEIVCYNIACPESPFYNGVKATAELEVCG